jgi:AraC-like DNA-binding protein
MTDAPSRRTLADVILAVAAARSRIAVLEPARGGHPSRRHPPLVAPSHHAHYELAVCFAGAMIIVAEERIHELKAGNAVLVLPGAWHYESYRDARKPYEVCWLVARPGEMRFVFTRYRRKKLAIDQHPGPPAASEIQTLDEMARELTERPAHWQARAKALLVEMLVGLDRRARTAPPRPPEIDPVHKLLRILETRFREPLQIQALAREAGLSPDHLSRRFKETYGATFKSYLNALRIHHAKLLLRSGWSVKRTATECGFHDVYYFGRVFKRACRIPPGRFVRQARANAT